MAGKIKKIIDQIIFQRAGTNQIIKNTTITKLQLKGIDVEKYNNNSPDDPVIIEKLMEMSRQLNTQITL